MKGYFWVVNLFYIINNLCICKILNIFSKLEIFVYQNLLKLVTICDFLLFGINKTPMAFLQNDTRSILTHELELNIELREQSLQDHQNNQIKVFSHKDEYF